MIKAVCKPLPGRLRSADPHCVLEPFRPRSVASSIVLELTEIQGGSAKTAPSYWALLLKEQLYDVIYIYICYRKNCFTNVPSEIFNFNWKLNWIRYLFNYFSGQLFIGAIYWILPRFMALMQWVQSAIAENWGFYIRRFCSMFKQLLPCWSKCPDINFKARGFILFWILWKEEKINITFSADGLLRQMKTHKVHLHQVSLIFNWFIDWSVD